jgi:hypothetical protein
MEGKEVDGRIILWGDWGIDFWGSLGFAERS